MKRCTKCGTPKDTSEFHKRSINKDGLYSWCKQCSYKIRDVWAKKNRDKILRYRRKYNNTTRFKLLNKYWTEWKEILEDKFGNLQCVACEYDKHFSALDFHHTDPTTKEKGRGSIFYQKPTEKRISQLDGTVILCANCHRIIHYGGKSGRV